MGDMRLRFFENQKGVPGILNYSNIKQISPLSMAVILYFSLISSRPLSSALGKKSLFIIAVLGFKSSNRKGYKVTGNINLLWLFEVI